MLTHRNADNNDEHLEYIEVKKYTDEALKDELQKEIKILGLKEI